MPTADKQKPLKVFFDKTRETKNTYVFTEDTKGGMEPEKIGSVYLKKYVDNALGSPDRIEVIVKAVKE